jgi:hypothetical protein
MRGFFWSCIRTLCLPLGHEIFLLYSVLKFVVLYFVFRVMVHFELIPYKVYYLGQVLLKLPTPMSNCNNLISENNNCFLIGFLYGCEKNWTHLYDSVFGIYTILLISVSSLALLPHCLNYYSFMVNPQIDNMLPPTLFLFSIISILHLI